MKFAREGRPFIAIAVLLAVVAWGAVVARGGILWLALAIVVTLIAVWVPYFFRDPERAGERGEQVVVAPADGRVVSVADVDEPAFLHSPAKRISIFMNVFDVHVNRYPVSGTVRYVHYNRGKFLHAAAEKASLENEQMSVGVVTGPRQHRILVRQIAGLIARRIANYAREGESVEQGERMGIIRFGSRVDVLLPPNAEILVRPGERTWAGKTIVARLPA
ncbi:MAG TPA: phosphatidylserine decarboxylase family protein [Gemmatimonadaceae bacterium]|nr:phosphatidylserine decarboxylase family protein [Gemmatimonadaceae bacterium]